MKSNINKKQDQMQNLKKPFNKNSSSEADIDVLKKNQKKTFTNRNTDSEKPNKGNKIDLNPSDENVLKINENYAKKFDDLKRREAIEKAKQKYGQDFFFKDAEEESEQESEDSEAELVNDRVLEKFFETIVQLQDDERVKELVQSDKPIFEEEDFAEVKGKKKKEKAYTIKDALLNFDASEDNNAIKDKEENDIFSVNYKEKNLKKVDKEKEEFMKVAAEAEKEADSADDFLDDGFLKVKKTNADEEKYFQEFENAKKNNLNNKKSNNLSKNIDESTKSIPEEISNLKLDEILKKRKNIKNLEVLKKFWGEGQNLDANEKFLRNYILSEAWLENDENYINRKQFQIDKEDEEKDQYFEEFEERYNFRYEEEGGANITTHRRDMESFRVKDDSKKIKRKERGIKKEEENRQIISDLQMAKDAKRFELKGKLEVLQKIAGTDKIKELADELEKDFDAANFDKIMSKIYNEEYYQTMDKEEDIDDAIEEKMFDYKNNKSIPNKEKVLEMERLENESFEGEEEKKFKKDKRKKSEEIKNEDDKEKGYKEDYVDEDAYINEEEENEEGENQWFYCDNCFKVIKENKIKYECDTCDDYCLCKGCFSAKNHQHKMKKSKVPSGCKVNFFLIFFKCKIF
jgi:protein KRI1